MGFAQGDFLERLIALRGCLKALAHLPHHDVGKETGLYRPRCGDAFLKAEPSLRA
jgi:hypothetical protein